MTLWDLLPAHARTAWAVAGLAIGACLAAGVASRLRNRDEVEDVPADDTDGLTTDWRRP